VLREREKVVVTLGVMKPFSVMGSFFARALRIDPTGMMIGVSEDGVKRRPW